MIQPGVYDIVCPQGATFDQQWSVTVDGSPMNLTGYTGALQVRETYDSSAVLFSLTSGSGITLGGTAGTIRADISAVSTAGVAAGFYAYDLELTAGSAVTRLLQGKFTVTGEITR